MCVNYFSIKLGEKKNSPLNCLEFYLDTTLGLINRKHVSKRVQVNVHPAASIIPPTRPYVLSVLFLNCVIAPHCLLTKI